MSTAEQVAQAAESVAETAHANYMMSYDSIECAVATALRDAFREFAQEVRRATQAD